MSEAAYLRITREPRLHMAGGDVRIVNAPQKVDRSRNDWASACAYFEAREDATLEDALRCLVRAAF